ncbi:HEPN domain-containing protein [Marinobacter salsuginis]|uniref:HEPN domain-containing protein n=1 Tax=Marinobacter salsuginis TaxID=418719 RepID=UPI001C93BC25|nr:HEPN domain-containing protein [Marinobacter salsuginis]MBY6072473.1 HEPN domain-containing protein [Marinobacter salsuginis]
MSHSMMQKVNSFALRAFRDTADRDYIHARMAYRADLFPQFHWSALHALEKYAKCIAILVRVPRPKRPIKHEVQRTLDLISEKLDISLSEQTKNFIRWLEDFGARFRYLEVSWSIKDCELARLDRAIWELRRFCNAGLYEYSGNQFVSVSKNRYDPIKAIDKPNKANTFIAGGFLEKTLEKRNSMARPDLVWCNLYYSASKRKRVYMKRPVMAENSPFFLYPEIIDEVSKYTFVPKEIIDAYKNG